MKTLFDTFEAAQRLGIARATLAKLRVIGGGPPFVKVGAKVLYDEQELELWTRSLTRHSSTSSATQKRSGAVAPTVE